MDWQSLIRNIDADTARAFVAAARRVIDALLIESERVRAAQTPALRDYNVGELSRTTPPDGWLTQEELRDTARRMGEAMAAEKWIDGLVTALKLFFVFGGLL